MSESKGVHHGWLIFAVVLFAAVILWGYLDQNHYFSHVKPARITSGTWENRQAKECASWNAKADLPVLECDNGRSELQQTVPVRFYGDTRRALDPDTERLHWTCSKREDSRPPISCKITSP